MRKRYLYFYYLKDLLVCDQHHITTVLDDMSGFERRVFECPDLLIKIGTLQPETIPRIKEQVREKFIEWNAMLDEYHVNEELRFDTEDLLYSVRFHESLFWYMPEEKCEEHVRAHRAHLASKKENS